MQNSPYPTEARARDRWILAQRPARQPVHPDRPHGFLIELERTSAGEIASTATVFLTNRECPWRCLMCDLWKTTLPDSIPVGAVPTQIDYAFAQLHLRAGPDGVGTLLTDGTVLPVPQLKLYNGGSFFDPRAIPPDDYPAIVQRARPFARVIVECHPALVRESGVHFRDSLQSAASGLETRGTPPQLEIALGLETAHPGVLEKLNKRMTLDDFSRAATFLNDHGIPWRAFVLVQPPFLNEAESLLWAQRSIELALGAGATAVSLIPTRPGNGALDELQRQGQFAPPKLATLEAALAYGISLKRQRVFADLWDLERFSECPHCFRERFERLQRMNLDQVLLPAIACPACSPP